MFLIRTAFWIFVVLAFLPIDRPAEESEYQVSTFSALSAAKSTLSDVTGFCDRNPDACAAGRETARMIGVRAQTGAIAVYNYFTDRQGGTATDFPADTLTDMDLEPVWVGPEA